MFEIPFSCIFTYIWRAWKEYRLQSVHEKARNLLDKLKHRNNAYYDRVNNPIDIKNK